MVQDILYFLSLSIVGYGVLIGLVIMYTEFAWSRRDTINYQNYQNYQSYFRFKPNKLIFQLAIGYFVLTLIFSYLLFEYPRIFHMTYILYVVLLLDIFALYVYYSRIKFNKDLSYFDQFYQKLESHYQNQESLIKNIEHYEDAYQTKLKQIREVEVIINRYIEATPNYPDFTLALKPFLDKIDEGKAYLKSFDKHISVEFDHAILNYLRSGQISQFNPIVFAYNINETIDKLVSDAKTTFSQMISIYAIDALKLDAYRSNSDLLDALKFYDTSKIQLNESFSILLIELLNRSNNQRSAILDFYLSTYKIPLNLVLDNVLKNDYAWFFEAPIQTFYDSKDFMIMLEYVIKNNPENTALTLLSHPQPIGRSVIDILLKNIPDQTYSRSLFETYLSLTKHNPLYTNTENSLENKAIALSDCYKQYGAAAKDATAITKIIDTNAYEDSEHTIDTLYKKAMEKHKDMNDISKQTLFLWHSSDAQNYWLDKNQVIQLSADFTKNLQLNESTILNVVLLAGILEYDQKPNRLLAATNLAKSLSKKTQLLKLPAKDNPNILKKTLLKFATHKENIQTFKRILNRGELERQSFDRFKLLEEATVS